MEIFLIVVAAAVIFFRAPEPPKVVAAPPDRVVLLPDAGGGVGAVILYSAAGQRTVNHAYQSLSVTRDGAVTVAQESAASVQARYGAALAAMPLPAIAYTMNFLENSTTLTEASKPVVEELKAELAKRPGAEILVIGHTDRVGSVAANDELSRRRADAVKDFLIKNGIAADRIETSGRGEREPLVPTADEVAEPRNRRVEVLAR